MKSRRLVLLMVTVFVAGCGTPTVPSSEKARPLSRIEMDQVSAGSAAAVSNAAGSAAGLSPSTNAVTRTLAFSGAGPVSAPPFFSSLTLNYAFSQVLAAAAGTQLAATSGSTLVGVAGGGAGASIDATGAANAAGSGAAQAEINMQFYGLTVGRVDLVFGTDIATACCVQFFELQTALAATGEGYLRMIQASPISTVRGQVQSRVDVSVVSSSLPILDAGQALILAAPTLAQISGQ